MPILCQNEKKRIPFTQRNLAEPRQVISKEAKAEQRLTDRSKGLEILRHADPEHRQTARRDCQWEGSRVSILARDSLQAETNAGVVDDTDVGVPRVARESTFLELPGGFQYDRCDHQQRLDLHIFCFSSSVHAPQRKSGLTHAVHPV